VKCIALLFVVLIAADIATTAFGLSLGAVEGNPTQAPVLAAFGLFGSAFLKAVLVLPLLALIRLGAPHGRLVMGAMGAVALALPVVWNFAQLASVA
jgi:hypothetical protein